ncbi:MAG TPA: phosphatidylserine/phosphatidylglycerophosphate/cardiolipin synthase family protein, partial [Sphingomicrobium sp.]|nr:phosphatidylserine/phosphatidylglycerophosphate/cardiolipin synthase family protein [Sphingomicrobium sp.]
MPRSDRQVEVDGNRRTLLPEGPQRRAALLDLIDDAQHSLRLLYYMVMPDDSGAQFRQALLRAIG